MSLAPGTRLGPYEITAPIDAGGMGEVWRAGEERLDPEVAIKVPPAFADTADPSASSGSPPRTGRRSWTPAAKMHRPPVTRICVLAAAGASVRGIARCRPPSPSSGSAAVLNVRRARWNGAGLRESRTTVVRRSPP